MATATAKDDDLLIIAEEDSNSDTSWDIEFSFDFGDDSSSNTSETESSEASNDTVEVKTEDALNSLLEVSILEEAPVAEISDTEIISETDIPEISLGMADETSENTPVVEASSEVVENSVNEDFSFDLSESDTETQANATVVEESAINLDETNISEESVILEAPTQEEAIQDTSSESSMNEILSATIAKLAARQEVIATSKAWKATKEEEIKAQIKELQSQLSELESEMKELDKESDKITANIAELENMKLDPVKEHNAKRVTKK